MYSAATHEAAVVGMTDSRQPAASLDWYRQAALTLLTLCTGGVAGLYAFRPSLGDLTLAERIFFLSGFAALGLAAVCGIAATFWIPRLQFCMEESDATLGIAEKYTTRFNRLTGWLAGIGFVSIAIYFVLAVSPSPRKYEWTPVATGDAVLLVDRSTGEMRIVEKEGDSYSWRPVLQQATLQSGAEPSATRPPDK